MADVISKGKYTLTIGGRESTFDDVHAFDAKIDFTVVELEKAAEDGKSLVAEMKADIVRTFERDSERAFQQWFKEMVPPVEPYKFPSVTVIRREWAIEHINAWFSQRSRTETDEEVTVETDILSDELRVWLVNPRSDGWISDNEAATMYATEALGRLVESVMVPIPCLTGETNGNTT